MRLLEGKTALVTGAAKRIGRSLALALAEQGAGVAITYRSSETDALATVDAIRRHRVRAAAVYCDLGDSTCVRGAVEATIRELGRIDVLVNNAGLFETRPLESITLEQWDAMLNTNTRGPFLMAQAAHAELKQRQGRIVNMGSLGGMHPWATHGHYCVSKAAVHMLTKTMAKAWAPEITVNCVAPGMIVNGEVDPGYEHFVEKTPMRRNGTPEDVAAAVVFFATGPRFITGQVLSVDGGLGL
ncbi:MAG TPA: SDR family oxidoreductase [Acidobacteriaceae bacterium]|jgi:3-oxoacyl-[acyl-carrier protein] reductase/pteridine reductase